MARKLASMGSTNANENLNNMIVRKAPKSVNFSESESLDTRVAAAVSQKNEGHRYILDVSIYISRTWLRLYCINVNVIT